MIKISRKEKILKECLNLHLINHNIKSINCSATFKLPNYQVTSFDDVIAIKQFTVLQKSLC